MTYAQNTDTFGSELHKTDRSASYLPFKEGDRSPGGHLYVPATPDIMNPLRTPRLKKSIVKLNEPGKGYEWLIFAMGAGITFGIGNYFLTLISDMGIIATAMLGPSGLVLILINKLVVHCIKRSKKDRRRSMGRFLKKGSA
jgi:hypothetical protein